MISDSYLCEPKIRSSLEVKTEKIRWVLPYYQFKDNEEKKENRNSRWNG